MHLNKTRDQSYGSHPCHPLSILFLVQETFSLICYVFLDHHQIIMTNIRNEHIAQGGPTNHNLFHMNIHN